MEDRKTKVTLAVQEVRDSLVGELDRIRGGLSFNASLIAFPKMADHATLSCASAVLPGRASHGHLSRSLMGGP